jgi:uncharacterized lipoprotein YddW (UPF0748 family)
MSLVLAALALAGVLPQPRPAEMRGLWVVRTGLTSPQAVEAVVEEAARAGVNTLFAQVRGRGDAFYASRLVPRSVLLERQPADFDPLAHLLRRARERGLGVHAWINVLLAAGFGTPLPRGHVLAEHPDWEMVPRGGRSADAEGRYLSPSHRGVGEHLQAVVTEILQRYPVDGLHLDFIRYPGAEYDYSRAAVESFGDGRGGSWDAHRRAAVDDLVARLSRAAHAARPGAIVSAAVVPDLALALHHRGQDWPAWAERGWVDALCPMTYTPDTRIFRAQLDEARRRAPGVPIWAGLGSWRMDTPAVVDKIDSARAAGTAGVVLFSHETLGALDIERLRAALDGTGADPRATAVGAPAR